MWRGRGGPVGQSIKIKTLTGYNDLIREFVPIVVERRDDISSTKARDAIRSNDTCALGRHCHPAE